MSIEQADLCDLFIEKSTGRFLRKVVTAPTHVNMMPIDSTDWNFVVSRAAFVAHVFSANWQPLPPESPETSDSSGVIDLGIGSDAAQRHGDEVAKKLKLVEASIQCFLTSEGRAEYFKTLKREGVKISSATYYKHVRRYLEGGLIATALRGRWRGIRSSNPDREKVEALGLSESIRRVQEYSRELQTLGAPSTESLDATAKGKPRQRRSPIAPTRYRVNDATLRVFLSYYQKKKNKGQLRLIKLYDDMRKEVFSTAQPYGPPILWPNWSIPTLYNFQHYWRALIAYDERQKAINGAHQFELKNRKLQRSVSLAFAAGRIGELDATVWNVELVGEGDDAPIIGSPVVFRIRCKDTGELLGIGISLESACWYGAASAIANCLEDKDEFCVKLGLPPCLGWLARGLPIQIDADQGETYNNKPYLFVALTGVSIVTMPGGRGDLKPGVESDWNTLQVRLNEITPGAAIKRYEEETGTKWHMKASMTLKDFMRVLIIEELKKMHLPRSGLKLPDYMVADNVNTSPQSMFEWSMRNGGGALKQFDETKVRLALLPIESASITERGLTIKNIHFNCPLLELTKAAEKARQMGRRTLRVAIDPLLIDRIWLIIGDEKNPSSYVTCTLNLRFPNQASYAGKTWREVYMLITRSMKTNFEHKESLNDDIARLSRLQDEIVAAGKARIEAARSEYPTTGSALIQGRDAARLVEKNALSPTQAITADLVSVDNMDPQAEAADSKCLESAAQNEPPLQHKAKRSRFASLAATIPL